MQEVDDIIRQELIKFVPSSTLEDVACFLVYDNHPRDEKRIDVTVCTKNGELKEFFQRDMLSSLALDVCSAPKEIIIARNSLCELFYVVATTDEVFIVSSGKTLHLHTKITNVDQFEVSDRNGNGQLFLRVTKKDDAESLFDAEPITYDENFQSGDVAHLSALPLAMPLYTELNKKYIETQFTVNSQEKELEESIDYRHAITLFAYQNIHSDHSDSVLNNCPNVYGALRIKTLKPWIKVCNRKLIVVLNVLNEYKVPIEDFHIVLHADNLTSLTYTTKLFEHTNTLPFWKQQSQKLLPFRRAAVVAVMNLDSVQPSVTSRIVFKGALMYKTAPKTFLMPFDDVAISSLDTLGDEFDALTLSEYDSETMIAILSTTDKTDLRMRLLKSDGETLMELFIKHLQMQMIAPNMVAYNKSLYHSLNGSMLHFTGGDDKSANVTAYTRSKSQLQVLIHLINDAIPSKIIITTPNYIITANNPELSEFSEPIPETPEQDYTGYAKTILTRTKAILEYLDTSMRKMGESNDPEVIRKIGADIDLYASGKTGYKEFRKVMIEEANNGVKCLMGENESPSPIEVAVVEE